MDFRAVISTSCCNSSVVSNSIARAIMCVAMKTNREVAHCLRCLRVHWDLGASSGHDRHLRNRCLALAIQHPWIFQRTDSRSAPTPVCHPQISVNTRRPSSLNDPEHSFLSAIELDPLVHRVHRSQASMTFVCRPHQLSMSPDRSYITPTLQ